MGVLTVGEANAAENTSASVAINDIKSNTEALF